MPVDIQIVSQPNLAKIESFLQNSSYRETIEFSANFNTRLCVERRSRLRLPFLDPQTGVAQNHSQLFKDRRQRMPPLRDGQIYTYPAARWRKSRRQYLNKMYRFPDRPFQALRKEHETMIANSSLTTHSATGTASPSLGIPNHENDLLNGAFLEESSSLGAIGGDTSDSKDSQQQQQTQSQQHLKEDLSKEWFFDDMDMNDVDSLEEPKSPADDEYDYDPRYGTKKRRKRRSGKRATFTPGEGNSRRRTGGRGRASAAANSDTSFTGVDAIDGSGADGNVTPTTTSGRRSRGTRGRRRTKGNACDQPLSPGLNFEPPSFESAAVGLGNDNAEEHADLRNYRKYL